MKNDDNKNPLVTLWKILSVPLSILGIASLSDNIVAWQGFPKELVTSYQSIIHPLWECFFSSFHIRPPFWVGDYLTIGLIVASASYKNRLFLKLYKGKNNNTSFLRHPILLFVVQVFSWPYRFIWFTFYAILFIFNRNKRHKIVHNGTEIEINLAISYWFAIKTFWTWATAIIVGFILLLIINYSIIMWE